MRQHKVFGQAKNVLKQTKREDLVKAYEALFATGDFRTPADDEELAKAAAATAAPAAAESASEETKPKAGAAPAATPAKVRRWSGLTRSARPPGPAAYSHRLAVCLSPPRMSRPSTTRPC